MNTKQIFQVNNLQIQIANYTCGPVSLLNILRLKGDMSYTEDELSILCQSKPITGTENSVLVKVARKINLDIIEEKYNAEILDIERNINNGAYVVVNYFEPFTGESHYSVITNYDKKSLYFADCYLGYLRIEKWCFKKWWHNADNSIIGWYFAVK